MDSSLKNTVQKLIFSADFPVKYLKFFRQNGRFASKKLENSFLILLTFSFRCYFFLYFFSIHPSVNGRFSRRYFICPVLSYFFCDRVGVTKCVYFFSYAQKPFLLVSSKRDPQRKVFKKRPLHFSPIFSDHYIFLQFFPTITFFPISLPRKKSIYEKKIYAQRLEKILFYV